MTAYWNSVGTIAASSSAASISHSAALADNLLFPTACIGGFLLNSFVLPSLYHARRQRKSAKRENLLRVPRDRPQAKFPSPPRNCPHGAMQVPAPPVSARLSARRAGVMRRG